MNINRAVLALTVSSIAFNPLSCYAVSVTVGTIPNKAHIVYRGKFDVDAIIEIKTSGPDINIQTPLGAISGKKAFSSKEKEHVSFSGNIVLDVTYDGDKFHGRWDASNVTNGGRLDSMEFTGGRVGDTCIMDDADGGVNSFICTSTEFKGTRVNAETDPQQVTLTMSAIADKPVATQPPNRGTGKPASSIAEAKPQQSEDASSTEEFNWVGRLPLNKYGGKDIFAYNGWDSNILLNKNEFSYIWSPVRTVGAGYMTTYVFNQYNKSRTHVGIFFLKGNYLRYASYDLEKGREEQSICIGSTNGWNTLNTWSCYKSNILPKNLAGSDVNLESLISEFVRNIERGTNSSHEDWPTDCSGVQYDPGSILPHRVRHPDGGCY